MPDGKERKDYLKQLILGDTTPAVPALTRPAVPSIPPRVEPAQIKTPSPQPEEFKFTEEYKPEAVWEDIQYIWNRFRSSGAQMIHRGKQFFVDALPNAIFVEPTPIEKRTPEGQAYARAHPEYVKEIETQIKNIKETQLEFQVKYDKAEAKNLEWLKAHPELQPKKEWEKGVIETVKENPMVLLDPAYIPSIVAESAAFSLAFLGTTIGVTAATKNPMLGLAAGVAVTTPTQSQELYEDLVASGASKQQAGQLAVPIGTAISAIEIVGALPLLGAISAPFKNILIQNIKKEIVKQTVPMLVKRGIKTFSQIEIAEIVEEVTQGAIQDATVKTFDENRDLLANIPETVVRTAIATLPFALLGGGAQVREGMGIEPEVTPTEPIIPEPSVSPVVERPPISEPVTPEVAPPIVGELREWFGVAEEGDRIIGILPDGTPLKATGIGAFQHRGVGTAEQWMDAGVIRVVPEEGNINAIEIRGNITNQQEMALNSLIKTSEKVDIDLTDTKGNILKSIYGEPSMVLRELDNFWAAIPKAPVTPEVARATQQVRDIQMQGRTNPESVLPEDAEMAHTELASPDGIKPPAPPEAVLGNTSYPEDIIKTIVDGTPLGERPDQTLLRLHEAAISNETRRSNITVREGSDKLKKLGVGVVSRGNLIPRAKDVPALDALYNALHNPSKVASGEITIPKGYEDMYNELRTLTNWEETARLDFDPSMATVEDYFYRGWKPPKDAFTDIQQGRPLVRTPSFKKPRANATYAEMRELGFEPLFWNPYQQWSISRMQGVKYREQMQLVKYLKVMGEDFIRPHPGGSIPKGWRVPQIGPAFEGKPFATADPVTGEPTVMFTRRWITEDRISNALEGIYGKRPDLGRYIIGKKTIDPMDIIDWAVFTPKRAKLLFSLFQQVDFLTRAGAGSFTRFTDALFAGQPVEATKALARYPSTFAKIVYSNFSPTYRLSLAKKLDNTTPLIQDRPGINLKGISEAGLSTRDVTIFPEDMDKLTRQAVEQSGVLGKVKGVKESLANLESAMRRGLFEGVYSAAIITDIENNIAPMVSRMYSSLNDAQINGMIARIANMKYSVIPVSQSVIQNQVLRQVLPRVFFSLGETEGLLRQATNSFHGPQKAYWRKHWIGVYLFLIVTANIIHFASTGEPLPKDRYSPVAKTKWGPLPFGYNRDFAAPTIPLKGRGDVEITLDLVGQMDTAFRVLDPGAFLTARESVPIRSITNQVSGTDFFGEPINDVGPGGIASRTANLLFDLFAPIGIGGAGAGIGRVLIPEAEGLIPGGEERLGISGLAVQSVGVNLRAETTLNLLNRYAKESELLKADGTPVEVWDDLEPFQKKVLSNNNDLKTELGLRSDVAIERQQLKSQGFATLDNLDQERIVRGDALVSEYLTDIMGRSQEDKNKLANTFRDEVTLLKREMSSRKAQVDIDFGLFEETGKLPIDANKRALVEYYNTFETSKRPSGIIYWAQQEATEKHYRDKIWTKAQADYVDRNSGLTEWGVLMAEYSKAQELLNVYWDTPESKRKRLRLSRPEIDAALVLWYGYKPSGTTTDISPITSGDRREELKNLILGK